MKQQSKQIIVNSIVKEIENGVERGKCLAKIVKKWQISDRTFDRYWRVANIQQQERQQKATEAADKAYIETQTDAAIIGLKSKIEKQIHIQKQIDDIQADLDAGVSPDYVIIEGKVQRVNKVMKPESKAYLRKTIKDLYAELNKMSGDYAPAKVAQTDTKGNDIPILNFKPAASLQPEEIETLTANEGS